MGLAERLNFAQQTPRRHAQRLADHEPRPRRLASRVGPFRSDTGRLRLPRPAQLIPSGSASITGIGAASCTARAISAPVGKRSKRQNTPKAIACPPEFSIPAKTNYIWLVEPGGVDEPNRLYVGTDPGGLFVSDDGGDSFQLVDTLWHHPSNTHWFGAGRDHPGAVAIQVDPRDSRHLTIGISVGGVYVSMDGGEIWEARNRGLFADYLPDPLHEHGHDPHIILASPSNPDVLWQQNHCGIFRSENRGLQWRDISDKNGGPAGFGFALAVDDEDERVAWVAPAVSAEYRVPVDRALVISRTEDGGETWQDLRRGLPQVNCYDLVFRHALDKTGDTLAFGTTAGNFYVSDDRGDNWATVTNNLAVVYSVRFM